MLVRAPNTIPFSTEAMKANLLRLQNEWEAVQASHSRNAIYGYLAAVFELITWWAHEGSAVKRAHRALHLRGYGSVRDIALARLARRSGATAAARFALVAGLTAAVISAVQFGLGLGLAATSAPGPAHLLFTSVDRLDGAKMLALAVLGVAAAAMTALPRWLRWAGIALAVAITCSGLVYLLLIAPLAAAAGPRWCCCWPS